MKGTFLACVHRLHLLYPTPFVFLPLQNLISFDTRVLVSHFLYLHLFFYLVNRIVDIFVILNMTVIIMYMTFSLSQECVEQSPHLRNHICGLILQDHLLLVSNNRHQIKVGQQHQTHYLCLVGSSLSLNIFK